MEIKYKKIYELTKKDLAAIRGDIVLCSIDLSDYQNDIIDEQDAYTLFDGYAEYLGWLMEDDNRKENYHDILDEYDIIDNLYAYYMGIDYSDTIELEKIRKARRGE